MKKRALILVLAVCRCSQRWVSRSRRVRSTARSRPRPRFHDLDKAKEAGYTVSGSSTRPVSIASRSPVKARWACTCSTRRCSTRTSMPTSPSCSSTSRATTARSSSWRSSTSCSRTRGTALQARALRQGVRRDPGRQPVRLPGVLLAARLDLEAEPERDALRLEPQGRLRSRGRILSSRSAARYAAAGASAPAAASCSPNCARRTNWPMPGFPTTSPPSTITFPRRSTVSTSPATSVPS